MERKPEKIRLAGIRTLTSPSLHFFLHSAVQIYEFHIFVILYTKCNTTQKEPEYTPAFMYLSAALSQSGFHFNQLVFML